MDCFKLETLFVSRDCTDEPAESMKVALLEKPFDKYSFKMQSSNSRLFTSRRCKRFYQILAMNVNQIFFSLVVKDTF
jgi:hypothetical protein